MGSRVNYVVIRDGRHTLFQQGGGAGYGLDYYFAVGPEIVLAWLNILGEDYRQGIWFGDGVCEGAVLIDTDRQVLLMFTNVFGDYAYRRALLDGYRRTWPGWEIRWAYDGVGDLITYLGLDLTLIRGELPPTDHYPQARYEGHDPEEALVYTVTITDSNDDCTAYGMTWAYEPWWRGPALIDWLATGEPLTTNDERPLAGLHLDTRTRTAGLWSTLPLDGLLSVWDQLWPGWKLTFWEDDYTRQVASSGGSVAIPNVVLQPHLRELAKRVIDNIPVRTLLQRRGTDVDWLYMLNVAGCRAHLDLDLTEDRLMVISLRLTGHDQWPAGEPVPA